MWVSRSDLVAFVFFTFLTVKVHCNKIDDYNITCKDENGNNVDWYYLYKLPNRFGNSTETKGRLFVYITANSATQNWTLSTRTLDDLESIPGRTIAQAYFDRNGNENERLLVAYNDEPPTKSSNSKKGHLKGVVVADSRSGFWLIHSVPLFPNISSNASGYKYPTTGTVYGQSFLCLSLSAKQINIVANQLIYNEPQIFAEYFPNELQSIYPNVARLLKKKRVTTGPFWNLVDLTTLNNVTFKSFAKSALFDKELYEDWVAPTLNTSLYAETWRKGPGNFPSNCSRSTRVWNISKVNINKEYEFTTTEDHSKWCVSEEESDWICVGDINRSEKQIHRGGGTMCYQSKGISKNYRFLIKDFEQCNKTFWGLNEI